MSKNFEKNRLDLAYKKQLTYLGAILTLATIGLLSFIGTFIWNKEYFSYGLLITIVILIISYRLWSVVDGNLKNISEKIKEL